MRERGSIVLIEKNKVALIRRVREDSTYYVFPGGGIKEDETPEIAAEREAFEELGVKVKVNECIAKTMFNGNQYFFLGEIINGYFGSGQGEEYKAVNRKRGTYQPLWVEINSLRTIDVRPKEVIEKILSYLNKKG